MPTAELRNAQRAQFTRRSMGRAFRSLVAGAVLAGAGTACNQAVDLDAVAKFADTAASASGAFDALAGDYGASCHRRFVYVAPPALLPFSAPPLGPAVDAPPDTSPPPLTRSDAACVAEDRVGTEWAKRNDILLGYVRALGALAGADKVPSFAPLGDSLVGTKLVTQKQDDAFTALLKSIVLSETRAGQEDAIARLAATSADPLREAASALILVDDAYAIELQAEYGAIDETYKTRVCDQLLATIGLPPAVGNVGRCIPPRPFPPAIPARARLEIEATSLQGDALVDDVNRRRGATFAYASAVRAIVATNDDIAAAAQQRPSPAQLVAIIKKHYGDIATAVAGVRTAVK